MSNSGAEKRDPKAWGLVIYRTTYGDDAAWAAFLRIFKAMAHDAIKIRGPGEGIDPEFSQELVGELIATLKFNVQDDCEQYDGADCAKLHDHFLGLVESDKAKEEIQQEETSDFTDPATEDALEGFGGPDYYYFIQVDEDSMKSVVADGDNWDERTGWINLINIDYFGMWQDAQSPGNPRFRAPSPEQEAVDWGGGALMRVAPCHLYPELYRYLSEGDFWDIGYKRPPQKYDGCWWE